MKVLTLKHGIFNPILLHDVDAICITTNAVIRGDGKAVMGAGVAKEAAERWPQCQKSLADNLRVFGNHVNIMHWAENGLAIISFPTKEHWKDPSKTWLIQRSAIELVKFADEVGWLKVALPPPGCKNGQLDWATQVKPVIESIFDDRFLVVFKE